METSPMGTGSFFYIKHLHFVIFIHHRHQKCAIIKPWEKQFKCRLQEAVEVVDRQRDEENGLDYRSRIFPKCTGKTE